MLPFLIAYSSVGLSFSLKEESVVILIFEFTLTSILGLDNKIIM